MSSPNYGEKNLRIKIPIEIVPEEQGIQEEVKDIQKTERERIEGGRREGRHRIYDESHPEEAYPRKSQPSLKGSGGMAEYVERKKLTKIVAGITATQFRLGQIQPSEKGTARVPTGGKAPADIRPPKTVTKTKSPDAGLHIYGADQPGRIEKAIGQAIGSPAKVQQVFSMFKNPIQFVKFLGPVAIPLIAALVAVEVAKKIIKDLVRKGSLFDRTFKNVVDNRVEVLRTREQQQRYLVGFGDTAQLITTTTAGTTSPRDSFNTYNIINDENKDIEEIFAIRNDSGYD